MVPRSPREVAETLPELPPATVLCIGYVAPSHRGTRLKKLAFLGGTVGLGIVAVLGMPGMESKIICKFADDTHGECWLINPSNTVIDYVTGDLSGPNGRISASGKFRAFAGRRSDPFFFNLGGARAAITAAESVCGGG